MAALCYSLPSLTLKPSPLNPKPYPNIPFLSHPKPNLRLPKKPTTTITRMSLNPTPATDRLISVAAYSLPFFNSLQYGRYLFIQYPQLGILFDPILPFLSLYKSVPYASFVAFFALYLGVVRNPSFSHYVRFNSMQAVTLDVLLVVPLLLTRIFNPGRVGLGFKVMVWGHTGVFVFSCLCFVYGVVSSILGRTPYLPFVADAAGDSLQKRIMSDNEDRSVSQKNKTKMPEKHKHVPSRDVLPGTDLWTDGLICAFEFIRGHKKPMNTRYGYRVQVPTNKLTEASSRGLGEQKVMESSFSLESRDRVAVSLDEYNNGHSLQPSRFRTTEKFDGSYWAPIGWERISDLVKNVQVNGSWDSQQFEWIDNEDDLTVADLAAPYWERPAGPIWWCHLAAGNPTVVSWLNNAQWLHPAVSLALRDESKLISERMKHLLYEVPVRVAGGLLFELLGQSVGDPLVEEDDIPIVLRSWQAQNFLLTVLHVKGTVSGVNVLGITEVQELLAAGGHNVPRTVHEVIAHLACRLTRWDDRLFRKSIFGAADEIELKFMNRRNHEDMNLFAVIMNQEIRRLSTQVIRVKWSLHAREEIVFELLQHLRGNAARMLLEGIRKNTREMIEEQEAVRGRLFTIQDVMQSTVRAWLQDRSLRVTHNLGVFGGCGLVLTIITGLFGINVDGIPGAEGTPYAFGLFTAILIVIGIVLIVIGMLYLGLREPINEELVQVRKLELQELVKMFQHEAEAHAQVRKSTYRNNLTPTSGDGFLDDADYVLIQ